MSRGSWVALLFALACAAGCGDDHAEEAAETPCKPGSAETCLCDDQSKGSQICNATGQRYSECFCHDVTGANNAPGNNGPGNNGPGNNGPGNNGPGNNGANNGPANNGPANNGPANNGPANNGNNGGPAQCEEDEDCTSCGDAAMCVCAPNPQEPASGHCVAACEEDEDCPPGVGDQELVCDPQRGFCVPPR